MAGISIRKAEPTDARRLADIAYRAWESGIFPLLTEQPGLREAEQRRLTQAVAETLPRIIVAEVDGIAVAWCSRSGRRAYIPFLFVMPELQGHGIGSMLLRRMESMLELEGAERVHLETPADNVRAVRFYERQGYRILALRPDGRAAHEPFMSVHLEKRLHPFDGDIDEED
ncbi:MAG: GNAT family N-acetyltransferase [Alphaproteobacteria bacterium]|jgi:2-amino-4-hydroxy-6-hydroxymethyldihydropteridine diphosphokinase|nr:GNAT family N-acetyltransferase [Alphaproteobacteria bacterium]MBU1560819.1 GNAT family N-acetyltransferase [Alphaproteobacteria bacterium]MBU2304793.1 GNAT family N-acetyltransferase [Alphaproteobacteria bacterium]MBU2370089.1 GNAT family N-acetyltransferase [Alphaproteobacteria bacterium]